MQAGQKTEAYDSSYIKSPLQRFYHKRKGQFLRNSATKFFIQVVKPVFLIIISKVYFSSSDVVDENQSNDFLRQE